MWLSTAGVCPFLWTFVLLAPSAFGSRGCSFPNRWSGRWYQKGVPTAIRIEGDKFSFKGICTASVGDMFLIEDNTQAERCYRCVVIYEKHPNVLQYRETFCDEYKTLEHACARLNVDAHLYSMFRVDAVPLQCPFKGPFTFTYSRGHGECNNPVSTIDSCTDETRVQFRFQACAEVIGTESSEEVLTCLATWKEGSAHYLVGKMVPKKRYAVTYGDSDSYRCFVYDPVDKGAFQVSQSGDATCDGLVSPWEGSRIMRLTKSKHPSVGCQFPGWVTTLHRWHTLDGKKTFLFSHRNTSFRITHSHADHADTKVTCTEEVASGNNFSTVIAYSMSGCDIGFACMTFHKRGSNIIEIQKGDLARQHQDACQPPLYHSASQEFVTLVTAAPSVSSCPPIVETNGLRVQGTRSGLLPDACRDNSAMVVGCRSHDTLEFLTTCASSKDLRTFQCHGGWQENGKSYLITGVKGSKAKYCFVYSAGDKMTQVSGLHDTCRRTALPGVTGNMTLNITAAGDCDSLSDTSSTLEMSMSYLLLVSVCILMR